MATKASRIALAGSNISSTGEVDADLLDNTDSSAFLSLAADGNFFIGTSSDIAPANGTNLYVSDGTISRFGLEKTGSDARKFSINNGGTYFSVYDETADAERFRISSTGNVGIGVTPYSNSKLTIGGTDAQGYSSVLMFDNNSSSGAEFFMIATDTAWTAGADKFIMGHGAPSSSNVDMTIIADGSVGIGTYNPTEKLHVKSSGNAYKMLKLEAATGAGDAGILLQGAAGNQFSIQQPGNAAGLFFYDRTNGITRLTITSDGKVKPGQFVLPVSTSAPASPDVGQQYYNSSANAVLTYNGTVWKSSTGSVVASGGTESTYTAGGISYKSHTFTSSGTFLVEGSGKVDIMIVAGGAAGGGHGGNDGSGGGGAGGMVVQTDINAVPGSYSVVIGAGGGATGAATRGNNGSNSSISLSGATTAIGGGGGGAEANAGSREGKDGGSGGGAGGYAVKDGGLGTNGQGNNGGPCTGPGDGGGGGKGAAGNSGTTGTGGAGSGNVFRTGSNIDYAGGGGGSGDQRNTRGSGGGAGGSGGGGAGANATSGSTPGNGSANTGGGGGGAAGSNYAGAAVSGSGGSGIVVIRYTL